MEYPYASIQTWGYESRVTSQVASCGMAGEVSFNAFVISIATSTAVQFGDVTDPSSGKPAAPNLEAAGQMIDMLALLEEKTKGNLTPDEDRFLKQVLYELRLRFIEAKRAQSGGASGH